MISVSGARCVVDRSLGKSDQGELKPEKGTREELERERSMSGGGRRLSGARESSGNW